MEEIICPKCKRIQKVNRNNLCSYCFYDLKKIQNRENNKKEAFPIDYNNLKDEQIVEYLKIDQIKYPPNKFIILSVSFSIILFSMFIFFLDSRLFPLKIESSFTNWFAIFISFITTFYSYRFFIKKYDVNDLMEALVEEEKGLREPSSFEKKTQFLILVFIFNIALIFFNLNFINNISSFFSPSNTYEVLVTSKNTSNLIEETLYEITVSNWRDSSLPDIKLKTNQNYWETIKSTSKSQIKVKRGFLSDVIWSFKQ